jgi:hypothetical protein
MKDNNINTEIELLKQDVHIIKTNHLAHIEADMRDVKVEVKEIKTEMFKFKYIAYGAIVVFVLMSDKFNDILRLL